MGSPDETVCWFHHHVQQHAWERYYFAHKGHLDSQILAATDDRLAFPKVKDADGKMVGPVLKTMKSEFVAWQETIRAKKYDLHDEKHHDQPEGALTERNMIRSQQTWVKTFM